MNVVHERCAGLDVHKRTVVACVLQPGPDDQVVRTIWTFGTMVRDLEQLRDWLVEQGVTHVVMEATGVYWKPVCNILEPRLEVVVGNARHLKAVPGRKTDVKDAEWLATLLRHGLVQASFIPDRAQRELRELTRYRTRLAQDRGQAVQRLQKTLEGANIKLPSVLTDIVGASGRRILRALVGGETTPRALADLADKRVQARKRDALEASLAGELSPVLRFLVEQQLAQIRALDEQIAACDQAVAEAERPFESKRKQLETIPGVSQRAAEIILAEIGATVDRFPTPGHLAAWAGVAPGNNQTGGKARPARTRPGNPWLKRVLTQVAWAAARSTGTFLGAKFRRLAARIGPKRAIVALAHLILTIIYRLLAGDGTYEERGVDAGRPDQEETAKRLVRQLEQLGHTVTLTPQQGAA